MRQKSDEGRKFEKSGKRKRAQYIHIEFENLKSRTKADSSNSENNNKLTFFAAFTSNGEKRENV